MRVREQREQREQNGNSRELFPARQCKERERTEQHSMSCSVLFPFCQAVCYFFATF
jgi:hypothetical protein